MNPERLFSLVGKKAGWLAGETILTILKEKEGRKERKCFGRAIEEE